MEEEHVTLHFTVTKAESFLCIEKELPCYMGVDSASFEILMIDIRHKLSQMSSTYQSIPPGRLPWFEQCRVDSDLYL